MYRRRPEDVQDVFWISFIRSICVLFWGYFSLESHIYIGYVKRPEKLLSFTTPLKECFRNLTDDLYSICFASFIIFFSIIFSPVVYLFFLAFTCLSVQFLVSYSWPPASVLRWKVWKSLRWELSWEITSLPSGRVNNNYFD